MAEKKSNREKLKEITASIEQGIQDLFQSDKYAEYLRTMSRFHSYSVRNTILIHMQRPDATAVAGFNAWKKKFQRNVERLFRRIKRFRRIFTRYDKLDIIFLAFVFFALIVDALM